MATSVPPSARIVHALPGRVRLHLTTWDGTAPGVLERKLAALPGVRHASVGASTGNALLHYDTARTDVSQLQNAAAQVAREPVAAAVRGADRASVLAERAPGRRRRMRIPVPGIEMDPALARRVLHALRRFPGVAASTSFLTARVLVEYDPAIVAPEELLATIAAAAPATAHRREHVTHPLERIGARHATVRLVGGLAGLGFLVLADLLKLSAPSRAAIRAASLLSILQGNPFVRRGLRRWLGHHNGDAVLALPSLIALATARSPVGLALAAADALRVLSDIGAVQSTWRRREHMLESLPPAEPDAVLRVEPGQRCPLPAVVLEGFGVVLDEAARVVACGPGTRLRGGTPVLGGAITVRLEPLEQFRLPSRSVHARAPDRWPDVAVRWMGFVSLAYAVAIGVKRRSLAAAYDALLIVNARAALVGSDAAETGGRARLVRMGGVFVGTRPERRLHRASRLVLGSPRLLTDGLEIAAVYPVARDMGDAELLRVAAAVSAASGAPWGDLFRGVAHGGAVDGELDARGAIATVGGRRVRVREMAQGDRMPAQMRRDRPEQHLLAVSDAGGQRILGVLGVRPRVAPGVSALRAACARTGTALEVVAEPNWVPGLELASRAGIRISPAFRAGRAPPGPGERRETVAFASDSPHTGAAFAACDLAIAITSFTTHFAARADVLAPDVAVLAGIVETLARRDAAVRDAVTIAALSNAVGVGLLPRLRSDLRLEESPPELASLLALGWVRYRLRGGNPRWLAPMQIVDPHPEQWGRLSAAAVLAHFQTSPQGLTRSEAEARRVTALEREERHPFLEALVVEMRSPLIGLLAAGGLLALLIGSPGDVIIILVTLGVNVVLGAWQNHRASRLAATLEHVRDPVARVRRDGRVSIVAAGELVPGDILLLAPGDRVAADARLITATGLELDEASLTGESFPAAKSADDNANGAAIVFAGTDVTAGAGIAVVVGVGRRSRMGAVAAALSHEDPASALGTRLARLMHVVVPIVAAGGVLVFVAGVAWGQPVVPQFALGLSIALAAFPEGLPLMAAVGQAAAARRLMSRCAFVRRTSAIEALGRVDVTCVDKTGTLTEGRLAVQIVSDFDSEVSLPASLPPSPERVLLTAALASPHPDAAELNAHPTDAATVRAAEEAGLADRLRAPREAEARFNSVRGFHSARVHGRVAVKGAFETLLSRCSRVGLGAQTMPLDTAAAERVLGQAQALAARGLRVLLVADGDPGVALDDPRELRALGLIALSDPLRSSVPAAVRRCQEAGIRVVMLTGDHPLTARAIGTEAGLAQANGELLNAAELAELTDEELERRLERVTLIARATPLDKLRIIAGLQRRGHTVAMTGDGINDAPALRLADAGVAMGVAGTEVARQAADLVLGDDDFTTLVEALVEGRGFWHNIRRALGLLLGGNLGEVAVVAAAAVAGRAIPLTMRQILATNLITDALPALAIATQGPEHRRLAALAREGTVALDRPLRLDIGIRALATAMPTTGAYLLALQRSPREAQAVAFASITASQLAQTLLAGRAEGSVVRPVAQAVAASGGALALLFTVPALRRFFQLVIPSAGGWLLVAGSCIAAPAVNRTVRGALNHQWARPGEAVLRAPAVVQAI